MRDQVFLLAFMGVCRTRDTSRNNLQHRCEHIVLPVQDHNPCRAYPGQQGALLTCWACSCGVTPELPEGSLSGEDGCAVPAKDADRAEVCTGAAGTCPCPMVAPERADAAD